MFKKVSIISLLFIVFIVFVFFTFSSISETLNWTLEEQDSSIFFEFEEAAILNGEESKEDVVFENEINNKENELESSKEIESLTLDEQTKISNTMTQFMSLDEVQNLTNEEWLILEEELGNITLNEMKRMSIGDFVGILRRVKNQ